MRGRFIAIEAMETTAGVALERLRQHIALSDVVTLFHAPTDGVLGSVQQARIDQDESSWLERIYGGLADLHDLCEREGGIADELTQGHDVICVEYTLMLGAKHLPTERYDPWYLATAQQVLQPDVHLLFLDTIGWQPLRCQQFGRYYDRLIAVGGDGTQWAQIQAQLEGVRG
jgi:hypothetical protein